MLTIIFRRYFNFLLGTVAASIMSLAAQAAPLYKCEIDGELAFQDTPCPPLKAKQKIACADVDGFAVYHDALSGECKNLPAGTAKNEDLTAKKIKVTAKSTRASVNASKSKTAGKDVIVRAYTKDDGTRVPSYTRSLPGEKDK
jgi:hypothetical protein